MKKMEAKIKAEWCRRLRSGEYIQGQCHLKTREGTKFHYCCMGVLAEIIRTVAWAEDDRGVCTLDGDREYLRNGDAIGLPSEIQVQLSRFNDIENWTFDQIADWIEENL